MLDVIPPGSRIFIDANIFLYRILEHWKYAEPVTELLKNINYVKYLGVTSLLVCNEIFHRVIIADLFEKYQIGAKHSIKYLKDHPEVIKELSTAWEAIENIKHIENLRIVGVEVGILDLALEYSKRYGLLSTDAIHVATMKKEGLSVLASNDRDFERVNWLRLWKP